MEANNSLRGDIKTSIRVECCSWIDRVEMKIGKSTFDGERERVRVWLNWGSQNNLWEPSRVEKMNRKGGKCQGLKEKIFIKSSAEISF